jgi:hypothetical protein
LLCAVAVSADDPWKSRTPNQWTKKEVDRILRDSPWTRTIATPTTWARTGGEKWGVGPSTTVTIDSRGVRGGTRASDDPDDPQNYNGYFLLHWSSSQIVRQALERRAQLKQSSSNTTAPKAQKKAAVRPTVPDDLYELELVWDLFARFVQATEHEVAMNSYLKPSRLGVEFKPLRVEYRRGPADVVTSVVFYFSKKGATGPLIDAQEDRVDFYWRVGPSSIGARFNPQKMVAGGKSDY